jgi:hypothetical protein
MTPSIVVKVQNILMTRRSSAACPATAAARAGAAAGIARSERSGDSTSPDGGGRHAQARHDRRGPEAPT